MCPYYRFSLPPDQRPIAHDYLTHSFLKLRKSRKRLISVARDEARLAVGRLVYSMFPVKRHVTCVYRCTNHVE